MFEYKYPEIQGISIDRDRISLGNFQEGKFLLFAKDNQIKLYGLLWKPLGADKFDLERVGYNEVPRLIYRANILSSWNRRLTFEKMFDINEVCLGGGYLIDNPWNTEITAIKDRFFPSPPQEFVKECLKKRATNYDKINVYLGEKPDITNLLVAKRWYEEHGIEYENRTTNRQLPNAELELA